MTLSSPTELSVQELVSPLGDPSSREIHSKPVFPPADIPLTRPLPGAETPFGSTVPPVESCSAFVVSHHHDGLLRAKVTGLLHPATGQGFAAFRASQSQCSPKATLVTVGSPREAFHTLRRVSLACSRTASLRPLPSCRYRPPPGTPSGRSQKVHRPSPTEARIGRLCARPPKRLSHPSQCIEPSIPRRSWATVRAEAGVPAPEGAGLPAPRWGGLDSRSAGRDPNAMMLRSAEADPHVTEHVSRTPAEAGERARAKSRAPCGDAEASSRDTQSNRPAKEATPVRPSRECFARGPKASVRWCRNRSHDSLGNLPRRRRSDAGDWARSNLAVQPTSRRCSADESVVPHRRCQRRDTRSFHGL
jgi:hypothetical protein